MCSCVEVRAWCDDAGGVATVTNIAFVTVLWFSAPTGKNKWRPIESERFVQ